MPKEEFHSVSLNLRTRESALDVFLKETKLTIKVGIYNIRVV